MVQVKGFAIRGLLKSAKEAGWPIAPLVGRLEGFPEIDRAHCVIVEGWLEGMGTALGAQDMVVRQVRRASQGGAFCEYEGTWSAMRGLFR